MNQPVAHADEGSRLAITGPAGNIEAALTLPDAPAQPVVAIVCHPLPTGGGTMHNKVVTMTARALRESGVTVVRFNFRGVGSSEGAFDHGGGELDDLRAVAAWVRGHYPDHALWLAGFSFGSWIALRACVELQASALITIAPPVGRDWDFSAVALPSAPWLVIQGDQDELVAVDAVRHWLAGLARPPQLVEIPEASHFFHRKLMDLRGVVKAGVRAWLPRPPAA